MPTKKTRVALIDLFLDLFMEKENPVQVKMQYAKKNSDYLRSRAHCDIYAILQNPDVT